MNTLFRYAGPLTLGLALLAAFPVAADAREHKPRFDPPGHHVRRLPSRHYRIPGNRPYYYHRGTFYRPNTRGYVVINAPIGARVCCLPSGYISFGIGDMRYFYLNSTYYLWDQPRRDYIVVEKPSGADQAMSKSEEIASTGDFYVYPRQGQSEEQRDRDRYQCHLWAKDQTGFDPSLPRQDRSLAPDYRRAITACLEGKGYTVR